MIDPNEKIKCVELIQYNPKWPQVFTDAANEIKSILQENCSAESMVIIPPSWRM